jgi:predicted nuclease of predicted toxin-antitoxin system
VTFLVDNQLPKALVHHLSSQGVECQHVLDVGLGDATDAEIWEYATQHDCVIITKDEDFFYLANRRSQGPQLVWVRFGNCRTIALLAAFDRVWSKVKIAVEAGDRIIELR